jgi:Protein of unknown function (DUF3501)
MNRLSRSDLMSLEQYSVGRKAFRESVLAHKKNRIISVGPNATWCFEDRMTVQYQVQEMLRVERIFEAAGIQDELDAYNPLIPDGSNWKATFLIEFPDAEERKQRLTGLKGVEDKCWIQIQGCDPVHAIADEDLERENDEKTSAVHFLRFELTPEMVKRAKAGTSISIGISHPNYSYEVRPVSDEMRKSLAADLAE